jgi:hypothetical protein
MAAKDKFFLQYVFFTRLSNVVDHIMRWAQPVAHMGGMRNVTTVIQFTFRIQLICLVSCLFMSNIMAVSNSWKQTREVMHDRREEWKVEGRSWNQLVEHCSAICQDVNTLSIL